MAMSSELHFLLSQLKDPKYTIRKRAVRTLSRTCVQQNIPTLLEALSGERHWQVRLEIVHAIQAFKDPRTAEALIDRLHDKSGYVLVASMRTLREWGETRALPALRTCLQHRNAWVRGHAALALEEFED